MFPYKQTPSQQVLWKIIWKMSSEWPHNQPLPSSGWRRKFIREVDLTNTRWRCSFFQKQEMSRNYSGFWLSIPLSAHFWKALAILFLAPSCEKKYVQSSNWETTADSLLILFSALSCHPGSHQKKAKWPNSQNNKISWEVLRKLSHATSRSHSDRKKFEDQHGAFERLTYENILSLMDYKSQLLLGAI